MRILMISTYPPRKCGIGEYASNTSAHLMNKEDTSISVCALLKEDTPQPPEVIMRIRQHQLEDYDEAIRIINSSDIDVVICQHEFGIYGGSNGNWYLHLLTRINRPVITVLHTLDSTPKEPRASIIKEIAAKSNFIVSTSMSGKILLQNAYQTAEARTLHIPLGAPDISQLRRNDLRNHYGIKNRKVAMTFGLLNPTKGIELVIDAIPAVIQRHPDFLYWVVGEAHPENPYGPAYYNKLVNRVRDLGVGNHVRFITGYQSENELINLLTASDMYINPYLKIEYVYASATLTYAAKMGKPILSSPIEFAQDLLAEGAGMIFPYEDIPAIASQLNIMLGNEQLRAEFSTRISEKAKRFSWEHIADNYLHAARLALGQGLIRVDELVPESVPEPEPVPEFAPTPQEEPLVEEESDSAAPHFKKKLRKGKQRQITNRRSKRTKGRSLTKKRVDARKGRINPSPQLIKVKRKADSKSVKSRLLRKGRKKRSKSTA